MPTRYSARNNLVPFQYCVMLNSISESVLDRKHDILQIFVDDLVKTDVDEQDPLLDRIVNALTSFAMNVAALPPRSSRQLHATVKDIAENPTAFLASSETYDPEATARVLCTYLTDSPDRTVAWRAWEMNMPGGPKPDDIAVAAKSVMSQLDEMRSRGRPRVEHQDQLAKQLARAFILHGGTIQRNYSRRTGQESGAFHRFLECVLPIVRPYARAAGFQLTVETMVRSAKRATVKGDGKKTEATA